MMGDDPICIVGIGCRYPGEDSSIRGFWDTIVNARSTHTEVPHDRFDPAAFHHPNHERAGGVTSKGGYFLRDGISRFDAPFFSITATEAASMDPQQRMLLEVAYETFENAGLTIDQLKGSRTGCYIGTFSNDYEILQNDIYDLHPYGATGTGRSVTANRVSWFYDLRGPSLVIDTACSSSMYAFHLACQSIRLGESTMALVGGCNVIISPAVMRTLSAMRFLSPTGQCHSYDQSADGYARGEGVGMVLLKRLSDAIASGDTVRAIVRASGVNQDGNTPGLTVPSASAQAALIRQCYEEAGISMDETAYFEGHGTGTLLGDPIELQAMGATFGPSRSMGNLLAVGSVKANVGHQEGGAGLAGLIRAILAMEKGIIPPTAELRTPNAAFKLEDWKIDLPDRARPWPRGQLRRISVNSFGFGGANSHVILEDARNYMLERRMAGNHNATTGPNALEDMEVDSGFESALATPGPSPHAEEDLSLSRQYLFAFSGFDQAAVGRIIPQFIKLLQELEEGSGFYDKNRSGFMSDLAFTLAERRTMFSHRIAFAAGNISELIARLQASQAPKTKRISRKESIAFVFTGQGAQYCGMSKGLLSYVAFSESLERSQVTLTSYGCEWNLIDEILRDDTTSQLDLPHLAQPICTAVQIAQVDLLASWGVHPGATVGHSSGEIAAAYASGKISHADAVCIAYHRGVFSAQVGARQDGKSGGMLAVGLGVDEASPYVQCQNSACPEKPAVVIACINSPQSVTLSGDLEAILSIEVRLKAEDVFARQLRTHHTAYHSPHMETVAPDYLASMKDIRPLPSGPPDIPMFSSVTGKLVASSAELDASYWVNNMLHTVKFSEAVHSMLFSFPGARKRRRVNLNHPAMLELGPSSALKGPITQILQSLDQTLAATSSYASMLKRGQNDQSSALSAMAQLWASGTPIDFAAINRRLYEEHPPQVGADLPPYPWNDSGKMWHDTTMNQQMTSHPRTDLLGYLHSWRTMNAPVWRNIIRISETPWLADHKIHTTVLYSGASMIVMALEAAQRLAKGGRAVQGYQFRDIAFLKALVIPPDGSKVEVQLHVWANREGTRTQESSWFEFSFVSLNEQQQWDEHCHGYFQIVYDSSATEVDAGWQKRADWTEKKATYGNLQDRLHHHVPKGTFYSTLRRVAMMYGPTFQAVETVYAGKGETHGVVVVPDTASVMPHGFEHSHLIHPATLDAIHQMTYGTMLRPDGGENPGAYVPISVGKLYIAANLPSGPGAVFRGYAVAHKRNTTDTACQIIMSDKDWSEPKVIYEDFVAMAVAQGVTEHGHGGLVRRKCAQLTWVPDIHHAVPAEHSPGTSAATAIPPHQVYPEVITAIERSVDVLRSGVHIPNYLQSLVEWAERQFLDPSLSEGASVSSSDATNPGVLTMFPAHLETLLLRGERLASAVTRDVLDAVVGTTKYGERSCDHAVIDQWLDNARLYNPGLSILLLGDGTPYSAACYVAKNHLSRSMYPDGFRKSILTELDTELLETTQGSLANADIRSQYAVFNPARSERLDGTSEQGFDLIIGSPDMASNEVALANLGAMLSSKGTLILNGPQQVPAPLAFFLGLSEEWSSYPMGNALPASEGHWKAVLSNSGLQQRGSLQAEAGMITLFATPQQRAIEKLVKAFAGQHIVLILPDESANHDAAAFQTLLEKSLASAGCSLTLSCLGDYEATSAGVAICLAELSSEVIASMSESTFNSLKTLVGSTPALVWLTRGAVQFENRADAEIGLKQSLAIGLFRSIRSELSHTIHVHVDISLNTDLATPRTAELLLDVVVDEVFQILPDDVDRVGFRERELVIDGRHILVPRLLWDASFNKELAAPSRKLAITQEPLYQGDRALRLVVDNAGHLDSLRWVDDDAQPLDRVLATGEVLIKVKAWALNFMDVTAAMGRIPTRTLGIEFAGEVIRCGPGCTRTRPGMRVVVPHKPSLTSYYVAHERRCQEVPADMDLASAASIPTIHMTVYLALITHGRLQRGETVLIHAAAGGIGQASVQMAQWLGAKVYATVGSNYKKQLLMDRYDIPKERIFSSRDLSFAQGIMRATEGKGVDVVVNSLAGEALRASWHCIAAFGRFIELGKRDILNNAGLEMAPFLRHATFSCVNLEIVEELDKVAFVELWHKVWELTIQGIIRPVFPINTFHVAHAEKALRLVASGAGAGKVVLTTDKTSYSPLHETDSIPKDSHIDLPIPTGDDCLLPVTPRKPAKVAMDASATYILCGGFGGIGRVIARFLASHGAKHLIMLSRSGATHALHHSLLKDMAEQDVRVTVYNCDISDAAAISAFAKTCVEQCWTVKGVVQCAMVLRDRMFENMTYDDWIEATKAKTQGTKYLSDALPSDLDFFILLSSTSGIIGTKGQANYAAANTYMDALATWRRARGMKATSLDLGVVSEAGYLAENPEHLEAYSQVQHLHITNSDLSVLLSSAIRGHTSDGTPVPAQVIAGFGAEMLAMTGCQDEGKFVQAMSSPDSSVDVDASAGAVRKSLTSASSIRDATHDIEAELIGRLSRALGIEQSDIDVTRPLHAYGVDSLVAVDLRNWISRELAADIAIADVLSPMPIQQLALKIASVCSLIPKKVMAEQLAEVIKELDAWSAA